jgi:hypothetical protein
MRRRLDNHWLACIASLLAPLSVHAYCPQHQAPDLSDRRAYVSAYVDALIGLKDALAHTKEVEQAQLPSDVVTAFKRTEDGLECANAFLRPYQDSPDENIQTAARGFAVAVMQLTENVDAFHKSFDNILDGVAEKPSEHADRVAKLNLAGDDAWHLEMTATVMAGLVLITFDEQKSQRLNLTDKERNELVHRLEGKFGKLEHAKGTLPGLESSVSVLLDFLTDPKRKPMDAAG